MWVREAGRPGVLLWPGSSTPRDGDLRGRDGRPHLVGLFSEINDNSVAILLTYGTARILLAGDAEANEEEYMANGPYTGPLTMVKVQKYITVL